MRSFSLTFEHRKVGQEGENRKKNFFGWTRRERRGENGGEIRYK